MRFILVVCLALGVLSCADAPKEPPVPNPNQVIIGGAGASAVTDPAAAPDFELPLTDGTLYSLSSRRGKVVIVNFWATWCGPCVKETPAFVALQEEWAERPFEIVGVSEDEEGFEVVDPFVERYGVSYPMVVDDGEVADAFGGVYAMPSSYVIDKEGRIVHRVIGEFPFEEMRPQLEALIGG